MSNAANTPNPVLDAAASYVAGKPVTVWCERSWSSWVSMTAQNGVPDEAGGFTHIGTPVVYVAPDICEELTALVGKEDVGSFFAADAILVLTHEAVHQRGITDEGVTDCTALSMVPSMATTFFGIPKLVQQTYITTVKKRINGKLLNVPVQRTRNITNPFLAKLTAAAQRWHDAQPSNYIGMCG